MIKLTRLNQEVFWVNPDLMEFMEATPDTIISLTTGKKIMVAETVEEVIQRVLEYRGRALKFWESLFAASYENKK